MLNLLLYKCSCLVKEGQYFPINVLIYRGEIGARLLPTFTLCCSLLFFFVSVGIISLLEINIVPS